MFSINFGKKCESNSYLNCIEFIVFLPPDSYIIEITTTKVQNYYQTALQINTRGKYLVMLTLRITSVSNKNEKHLVIQFISFWYFLFTHTGIATSERTKIVAYREKCHRIGSN